MKVFKCHVMALMFAGMAWACSDDDPNGVQDCISGTRQECHCDAELTVGSQICIGDGAGWSDCRCDAFSEGDTETETTQDSELGTEPGTGLVSEMLDCDGGKLDPVTNLCWAEPMPFSTEDWPRYSSHQVSYQCENLDLGGHTDWRVPNIDELASLIRGCHNGIPTGDLSRSLCQMTPFPCMRDDYVTNDPCTGQTDCNACPSFNGPGVDGCYWDPALTGQCSGYWATMNRLTTDWAVSFSTGGSGHYPGINQTARVRCVRNGP